MNVLLKQVKIVCSASPFHLKVKDILIIDGKFAEISDKISRDDIESISGDDFHVSIGWADIFADFAEPGNEYRETLESGASAAAAGGFTDVMLVPNTSPAISAKAQITFLKQRSSALPINIYPIGAITKNTDGAELAEMYDMLESGAVAFSDGRKPVQQSGILLKAFQYVNAGNAVIIQLPDDNSISSGGLMNEGISSTLFGLPGTPALAEELMVARDIALLQYTASVLHITGVSTAKSLDLIKEAKSKGLRITCSVSPAHLKFCDDDLAEYDSNLKLNPPLRTRADVQAMQQGLKNGDIDCVASHHQPQCSDDKICEFEYAGPGMVSLQTMYATLSEAVKDTELVVKILSEHPRNIFPIKKAVIAEGAEACLTVFAPNAKFLFTEAMIRSKSKNSAFINRELTGRVIAVIIKNKLHLNGI